MLFSGLAAPFYIPASSAQASTFPTLSRTLVTLLFFPLINSHLNGYEVVSHPGFVDLGF